MPGYIGYTFLISSKVACYDKQSQISHMRLIGSLTLRLRTDPLFQNPSWKKEAGFKYVQSLILYTSIIIFVKEV